MSTDIVSFTAEELEFFLMDVSESEEKQKHNNNLENEIYVIYNYTFNGLQTAIRLFKLAENYKMIIYVDEYYCKYDCEYYNNMKCLFVSLQPTLKDMITFIFDFRKNHTYSKVTDWIIENTKIDKLESRCKLMNKICNNQDFEECCVCLEFNSVKTTCKHNICRTCYSRLEPHEDEDGGDYIPCPLCRESI